jgi:hypothetical protein
MQTIVAIVSRSHAPREHIDDIVMLAVQLAIETAP